MAKTEQVYSDDEVKERLTGPLQHWYLEDGWLRRKY
ncbi:MAG TPA: 4a-hydroxytetrahydrobiopterin dehydratase, partial [Paraburkholderia sp.]